MTDKQIQEQIDAIHRVTEEACKSPEAARKYLQDAGIIEKENQLAQSEVKDIEPSGSEEQLKSLEKEAEEKYPFTIPNMHGYNGFNKIQKIKREAYIAGAQRTELPDMGNPTTERTALHTDRTTNCPDCNGQGGTKVGPERGDIDMCETCEGTGKITWYTSWLRNDRDQLKKEFERTEQLLKEKKTELVVAVRKAHIACAEHYKKLLQEQAEQLSKLREQIKTLGYEPNV